MINRSVKDKLSEICFVLQEFREKHEKHFFDAGGQYWSNLWELTSRLRGVLIVIHIVMQINKLISTASYFDSVCIASISTEI